jgi:hypothetical protein
MHVGALAVPALLHERPHAPQLDGTLESSKVQPIPPSLQLPKPGMQLMPQTPLAQVACSFMSPASGAGQTCEHVPQC